MDCFPADIEKFQKYADTQIDLHTRKFLKDGLELHFFTFKKANETFALSIDTGDRLNLQGPILMTKNLEGSKYQKMGSKNKFQDLIIKSELFSTNHLVSELLKQKAENAGLNRTLDEVEGENTHFKADLEEKIENEADSKNKLEAVKEKVNTLGVENVELKNAIVEMKDELLTLRERYSQEVKEMERDHSGKLLIMRDEHERTMGRYFISFLKSDSSEVSKLPTTLFLDSSSPVKESPVINKTEHSAVEHQAIYSRFLRLLFLILILAVVCLSIYYK